ncbi:DAK2 domain-containing protein [Rhizobium mayense]|uniref:DAK2 domain-containing protein n=1 Tax=Rhizobium mayense TaxID=1312184 RepID=A0ABT7K141_9HYPH|nr:DAK2 domain-containing protein [Rhizobium mayense]MDL2401867.1 DAK2 domain-containing protein [Rhizobium mayense]
MELTVAQIVAGVRRAADSLKVLEQELNAADAKLGDGDTGSMLARVIGAMATSDVAASVSVSEAFGKLARAAVSATGSSLGTLLATALLTMSKQTKSAVQVEWRSLPVLLAAALEAMIARGGAALGDKTVLDALEAITSAMAVAPDAQSAALAARQAAFAALDAFRDRPCRMGRAKFFAERSIGLDDPGMLAIARLVDALATPPVSA